MNRIHSNKTELASPYGSDERRVRCRERRAVRAVFMSLSVYVGIHIGVGMVSEIIYSAIGAVILLLVVRLVRGGGRL